MAALPSGTVTFLFSGIEDSARLWEQFPSRMEMALLNHDCRLRQAIASHGGYLFRMTGDSCYAAFSNAREALAAALEAQVIIANANWSSLPIRVRIGLHTGFTEERDGDYFGPALDYASQLLQAVSGGKIVVSQAACEALSAEGQVMNGDDILLFEPQATPEQSQQPA
jgi:class 3 adenylate cyclase